MSFDFFQIAVFSVRDRSEIRITVDDSRVNSAERIIRRTSAIDFRTGRESVDTRSVCEKIVEWS